MAEFTYNNFKNAITGHIPFELNFGYHLCVSFGNKCNAHSRSSSAEGLAMELRELMNVYYQNLLYTQDLQKQAHDKRMKPWSYVLGEMVNSKHIKTKRNRKFKIKFYRPF